MTKVLFLAERTAFAGGVVPPHGSGAHVAATIWGLERHFEVMPLLAAGGGDGAAPFGMPRVKRAVPSRVRGLRQDLLLVRGDREFTARALAEATSFGPDLVYERNEYLGRAGRRLASALGVPHVLEVNGLADLDYRQYYRSLAEPLGAVLERRKLRTATATVTVTPGLGRLLVQRGAPVERLVVIPNTVDPAIVQVQPRPARRDDPVVIGWIGHPMPWHRLDLLAEAAALVVAAAPRARFEIVGAGATVDALRNHVGQLGIGASFGFAGAVPRADLDRSLARFDIGVIPGIPEYAFPVKLVEMGAIGIPVVAPRAESLDEMLEPGLEYAPFAGGDVGGLAETLLALIADPELRGRLGAGLHTAVRARYTWDASAAALGQLVERLVSAKG